MSRPLTFISRGFEAPGEKDTVSAAGRFLCGHVNAEVGDVMQTMLSVMNHFVCVLPDSGCFTVCPQVRTILHRAGQTREVNSGKEMVVISLWKIESHMKQYILQDSANRLANTDTRII